MRREINAKAHNTVLEATIRLFQGVQGNRTQPLLFSKPPESIDSGHVVHSRDSPATRPAGSGLPAPF